MRLLVFAGFVVSAGLWLGWLALLGTGDPIDVRAYFLAGTVDPYRGAEVGARDAFLYSPAFAQAVEPLRWLGLEMFVTVWRLAELAALFILTGPVAGLLLFVRPVAVEINAGNVHLLMALAIVAGFRWPAAWAFVLLTKVTPGVGLLWFLVRREWRNLGIALGATAVIVVVSFVVAPGLWFQWAQVLADAPTGYAGGWIIVTPPLWLRLPAAALLVAWGATRNYRWAVVVAATMALPATWITGLSMLCGLVWLRHRALDAERVVALASPRVGPEQPERQQVAAPVVDVHGVDVAGVR